MGIMEEFLDWENYVHGEINTVRELLCVIISSESQELISDLSKIEAHSGRIGEILAKSNYYLDVAKSDLLPASDYGTELSRRIKLDELVAPIRCVRDTLDSFSNSIRQKLIYGESVLRHMNQFPDHKQREPAERPF